MRPITSCPCRPCTCSMTHHDEEVQLVNNSSWSELRSSLIVKQIGKGQRGGILRHMELGLSLSTAELLTPL